VPAPGATATILPVRRLAPLLLLGVLTGLFLAGHRIRTHLGLELSPASIQGAAALLGWKGPALFMGLVSFPQFALLRGARAASRSSDGPGPGPSSA